MENPNESAIDFLQRMYAEVEDDYHYRGRKYTDLCAAIAYVVGKKLLRAGHRPTIEKIAINPEDWITERRLVPARFEGRVKWTDHYVCTSNQFAWDPVLGKPEPVTTYSAKLFGEQLEFQPFRTTEQIGQYGDERILLDFS